MIFFKNIKQDIERYIVTESIKSWRDVAELFLYNYSLWVIVSYRFGRWIRMEFKIPIVKTIFKVLTRFSHSLICLITGIQIPFEATIGQGLYIGHTGLLVINADSKIGSDCNIGIGVIIGQGGRGEHKGSPEIGDRVYIGVGAKVIGKIKIGDDVTIGANAVVTKNVPPKATVAGVPAQIINYSGSQDFIRGVQ
jgi:serine O-acetyltransferase